MMIAKKQTPPSSGKVKGSSRKTKDGPTPVDGHVGGRIRARRIQLGLSQKDLGDAVGLTFQQIQKYERGANRVGSGRLFEFGQCLNVPVSFFFEGLTAKDGVPSRKNAVPVKSGESPSILDKRETLELMRAYYKISDPKVRRRFFDLVKAAANFTPQD